MADNNNNPNTPVTSSNNYDDTPTQHTNTTPKDPYSPSNAPTEMFEPVTPETVRNYEENNRAVTSSNSYQSDYSNQYTQPHDPYSNHDYGYSNSQARYDEYNNRPRQYFPNEPQNARTGGNDYITRNEMLEDENQRLRQEYASLQHQKNEDDEEYNNLQEDYKKKDNLYKTFLVTTMLAAFLSLVLLFWHPLGGGTEVDPAKDAEISQLKGQVEQLTKERDEAVKNTGDTNGQVTDLQKQLNDERNRADEAERNAKNLQSDLDRTIKERDEARADADRAATPTTVTETQIVTVPGESSNSNSRGNSNSNSASDALNSFFNN